MPDWLQTSLASEPNSPPAILAWRIGVALLLGVAVAGLYRWARRGEVVHSSLPVTLILLATVIAMATQIIGDNIARAFSLVGALSVVRFRTVVKDTQDTAFVIFAVVVGMAAGANHLAVGLVGLGILSAASIVLWPARRSTGWQRGQNTLSLRIGAAESLKSEVDRILANSMEQFALTAVSTARQGACLDLIYRVRLRPGASPVQLVHELNAITGIENVQLSQPD
jgi:Domain of unknown function (DUF4956)